MRTGLGKVLPGPCTLAEEAAAAIETIERQYPEIAGLIGRMGERIKVLEKSIGAIEQSCWGLSSRLSEVELAVKEAEE